MAKKKKITPVTVADPLRDIFVQLAGYIFEEETQKICIKKVEHVLYDNAVIHAFMSFDRPVSIGQLSQEINQFTNRVLDIQQAKIISWMLKTRLTHFKHHEDKKSRRMFDGAMLDYVKTALWLCAYSALRTFTIPLLSSDVDEALCRLQGVFSNADEKLNKEEEKEKYLINILSLKDRRWGFLPYPEHISPFDLVLILEDNGYHHQYPELYHFTLSLQSSIYNAYERYHIFKFVRDIIKQLIQEDHGNDKK